MNKPKSKPKAAVRSIPRSTSKSRTMRLAPSTSKTAMRPDTKHARIIAMLRTRRNDDRSDHDRHSLAATFGARFLAGVVRKKLDLNLVSKQTDKGRAYRIKDGKVSSANIAARRNVGGAPQR